MGHTFYGGEEKVETKIGKIYFLIIFYIYGVYCTFFLKKKKKKKGEVMKV